MGQELGKFERLIRSQSKADPKERRKERKIEWKDPIHPLSLRKVWGAHQPTNVTHQRSPIFSQKRALVSLPHLILAV